MNNVSLKHKRDAGSVFKSASDIGGEEVLTEDYVKGFKEGFTIGHKVGYEIGFKYGLEEGKHQKVMEFACAMKQDGVPIEQIIRYSGFSSEEIERL